MRSKRGQAAMEFLTTYGWAFMILLLMIGAISYLGITRPGSFVPDRCDFSPEVLCQDHQAFVATGSATESVAIVSLRQTYGRTLYLVDFECANLNGDYEHGFYHLDAEEYWDYSKLVSQLEGEAGSSEDAQDRYEWEPREEILLKCVFTETGLYSGLEGERVKVPMRFTFKQREGGFNHIIEGDMTATVNSVST